MKWSIEAYYISDLYNNDNHHDHHDYHYYHDDYDDDDDHHGDYQHCEVIEAICDAAAVLTDVPTPPPSLQHIKADMRRNI